MSAHTQRPKRITMPMSTNAVIAPRMASPSHHQNFAASRL
jgi:hypothetical protein